VAVHVNVADVVGLGRWHRYWLLIAELQIAEQVFSITCILRPHHCFWLLLHFFLFYNVARVSLILLKQVWTCLSNTTAGATSMHSLINYQSYYLVTFFVLAFNKSILNRRLTISHSRSIGMYSDEYAELKTSEISLSSQNLATLLAL
jgi:hypothetical protein